MERKLVSILITAMLVIGAIGIALPIQKAAAVPPCQLVVEPQPSIDKWSDVDHPGDTFTVTVTIYDVPDPGFYGWEFWLSWTPGVINCTLETLNTGIFPAYSTWDSEPIKNVAGTYHQSMTARVPSTPQTGTWLLVTLTFKIVASAPFMGTVSTDLTLSPPEGATYCIATAPPIVQIPHDFIHGLYVYHWAPPTLLPHLEVEYTGNPGVHEKTFSGKNIYKTPFQFSVDVVIKNVDAGWRLAGTQFILTYNTTVLDVLGVAVGGPSGFFEPFTPQTWNYSFVNEAAGYIRIAYIIFDIVHMTAPYGDGLIATITFNATYQEKFPISVTSDLNLEIDTEAGLTGMFANYKAEPIPTDPSENVPPVNGKYTLAGYVVGRVIDVYTQYLDDYNGKGPETPSDMFWPQKEVILYAKVTYNEWPVQQKPVVFEVRAPDKTVMTVLTNITDEDGIAYVSFRMNWPCVHPEDLFGVWTVTASVDIACIVVTDTLQFHYDYLVHWTSVTTDKAEYAHCETITITVNFTSHAMQTYWVCIVATLQDELNYPAITGTVGLWVKIGGAVWCTPKPYTLTLRIHVDKSVAAGEATIHVSALTNLPSFGGCALCPEATKKISILAMWAP